MTNSPTKSTRKVDVPFLDGLEDPSTKESNPIEGILLLLHLVRRSNASGKRLVDLTDGQTGASRKAEK